jgi:hypothetical protein
MRPLLARLAPTRHYQRRQTRVKRRPLKKVHLRRPSLGPGTPHTSPLAAAYFSTPRSTFGAPPCIWTFLSSLDQNESFGNLLVSCPVPEIQCTTQGSPGRSEPAGPHPTFGWVPGQPAGDPLRPLSPLQRVVDAVASGTAESLTEPRPRRDAPRRGGGAGARLAGSGYPRVSAGAGPRRAPADSGSPRIFDELRGQDTSPASHVGWSQSPVRRMITASSIGCV